MASTGSSTSGTTTTGSEIISSVNQSGSGIDLKSLVTGLVNAETSVAQSQITKKVENTNLVNIFIWQFEFADEHLKYRIN